MARGRLSNELLLERAAQLLVASENVEAARCLAAVRAVAREHFNYEVGSHDTVTLRLPVPVFQGWWAVERDVTKALQKVSEAHEDS